MLLSECRIGTKVICVSAGDYYGKIGYISDVVLSSMSVDFYEVIDDKNKFIGSSWRFLSSWDVYKEEIVSVPLSTECPCGIHRADCEYHK
jgi:hypothetical protein